ncbi:MAG: Ig-like domain-containing protein [Nevskiales bacterium]|nr:Ig-like domain-containing protein [Nevskiales bacterium]
MRSALNVWGRTWAAGIMSALLLVGCGGGSDSPELASIEIEPAAPELAAGTDLQLAATGIYSDGSKRTLTTQAEWASAETQIATVATGTASAGLVSGLTVGTTTVSATVGGISGNVSVKVTPAVPTALTVTPSSVSMPLGSARQLTATATFSDNSTQDVTATTTWSSNSAAIASVSNADGSRGLVQSNQAGSTVVSGTYQGFSDDTLVTVTAATIDHIEVGPGSPSLAKGTTLALSATAIYTNNTTQDVTQSATWTTANAAVATVGDAAPNKGVVNGVDVGSAEITASYQGKTATTTATVTQAAITGLQVSPATATLAKGTYQAFVATALFSDGSTQTVTADATWVSNDVTVATISNAVGTSGRATAVAEGQTTIMATYMQETAEAALTVTPAAVSSIEVTPADADLPVGITQQYAATGIFTDGSNQDLTASVMWSSSDETVVDVSDADGSKGLAAGQAMGTATISATLDGVTGSTGVTVTDAVLTSIQVSAKTNKLPGSFYLQYTATGLFSDSTNRDVTTQVVWSTSDDAIAVASNAAGTQGRVEGGSPGTVNVIASQGDVNGKSLLTVTDATLSSIGVSPASKTLPKGLTQRLTATGVFSDSSTLELNDQVQWYSTDATVASVSNGKGEEGRVSALAVGGPVQVNAEARGKTGTADITVSAAELVSIAVNPPTQTGPKGVPQTFTAVGTYTDSSTAGITDSVTWSSSDPSVATISNAAGSEGKASTVGVGQTTIEATSGSVSGSATLTVTDEILVSLAVTPVSVTLAKGRTQQFMATGTYSDNSTRDLTGQVQWTSDMAAVATVSNAAADAGLATAVGIGGAVIKANMPGVDISDTALLEVTAAVLDTIEILPVDASVPKSESLQLTAVGHYSDQHTEDLTDSVTWASSDEAIATVNNGGGTRGLAFGKAIGSVTITATDPVSTKVGSAPLTVTAALLKAITITPAQNTDHNTLPVGFHRQYVAVGEYGDQSTQDLTDQVAWSTISPSTVTISDAAGSKGLAAGVAAGTTTISAMLNGVQGVTQVTATNAAISTIAVSPAGASFGPGDTLQYSALATFDDGNGLDVTIDVTWDSSNPSVATISNADGSKGLATAGSLVGSTTISATRGGVSGSTTLSRTLF